jgi:glycosyltransferase involved in cell wall biosynthesis
MGTRRVLHVLDTAEPAGSAIFSIVESLVAGVDRSRYEFEVCFLQAGELAVRLSDRGVKTSCLDWNGSLKDPAGMARYAALLRSASFSIIHQHTGGRLLTGMGRRLTQARIVRSVHARASEDTGLVSVESKLPTSDATIANSRIVAEFSGDPDAVVIYPGIDPRAFTVARKRHAGVVVGTACRLELIKGLSYLLQAAAPLVSQFPDLRLEIAGEGSLRGKLEAESRKLGINRSVSFAGWQEDLAQVMAGWDIFALPSLDEGFGFAALEAMAAGLPVAATNVGGLPELVVDGQTGWLVPARDSAMLADCLRRLIADAEKRDAMGAAGRQRAQKDFPLSRMVEQVVAVYDRVLS